jgi:hypothetical protein
MAMSDEPRAPLTTTTSIRPAATVLILAIVMLVVFIGINAVFDQGTSPSPSTIVIVGGLNIDATAHYFEGCYVDGEPPTNIGSAFLVPVGSRPVSSIDHHSESSYDCSRELAAAHSQGQILGFYRDQLTARGWQLFSHGPAPRTGQEQYLYSKAGSDTFFWVVGITINAHHNENSAWTVYLEQKDSLA